MSHLYNKCLNFSVESRLSIGQNKANTDLESILGKDAAVYHRSGLTDMERYLFDLNGYLILRGALSPQEVTACNESLDSLQDCRPGEWRGRIHGHNFTGAPLMRG